MHLVNHHSVTSVCEVNQICKPLFDQSDIVDYVHARIFDNGRCYSLVTHAEQQLHHFKNEYKVTPPIPSEILAPRFYYLATGNEGPFQPVLHDFRSLFNLWYPFFMIERFEGYYDLAIFFSTPNKPEILNFYLNNINLLENFNQFFKNQAASLISEAEKNVLILPERMRPNFGGIANDEDKEKQKLVISSFNKDIKKMFSKRELECIEFLSYGFTMKEIARELKISPRTIEDYINNLKIKLKVERKSKIISAFKKIT